MKITLPRAVVEQALHVAENAGYPLALIKALRDALAQQAEPPKASAAGHGMAWPGLASSGLARSSQTGNGGQR